MKKSIFLLPLLAAGLALTGCGDDKKDPGKDDPGKDDEVLVLDFTGESPFEFPFVSDVTTLNVVSYEGIDYNSMGVYDDGYNGEGNLNFASKKLVGDGKVEEGENMPFFANADAFEKEIKSIDVIMSSATGGVDLYVDFPDSAVEVITAGSEEGTKKVCAASTEATYSFTNKSGSKYFSICCSKAVNQYRKNGKLATIKIHF